MTYPYGSGRGPTGARDRVPHVAGLAGADDLPGIDEAAAVAILGAVPGTVKMVANAAITAGAMVYTAAAGKVSPTYGGTLFLVGRALTAAAADGDLIEVAPCFPMVNSVATL